MRFLNDTWQETLPAESTISSLGLFSPLSTRHSNKIYLYKNWDKESTQSMMCWGKNLGHEVLTWVEKMRCLWFLGHRCMLTGSSTYLSSWFHRPSARERQRVIEVSGFWDTGVFTGSLRSHLLCMLVFDLVDQWNIRWCFRFGRIW